MFVNTVSYKGLSNAKRRSVLRLHPKSSLCSCRHYILDRMFRVGGDNLQQPPLEWKD